MQLWEHNNCFYISIHSLRVEGDALDSIEYRQAFIFQSTPSVWRETIAFKRWFDDEKFQSTPSVWRETKQALRALEANIFQSTPSVWRETVCASMGCNSSAISIHSLRVEGDSKITQLSA